MHLSGICVVGCDVDTMLFTFKLRNSLQLASVKFGIVALSWSQRCGIKGVDVDVEFMMKSFNPRVMTIKSTCCLSHLLEKFYRNLLFIPDQKDYPEM